MNKPFTLLVETTAGKTHQHGYHLGTDERIARLIAEEYFRARKVVTVSLMLAGRTYDVFNGQWFLQK